MNPKLKQTIKHTAPFAAVGTLVVIAIASPISWGMLAYGLLKIGKATYQKASLGAKLPSEQDDLFI